MPVLLPRPTSSPTSPPPPPEPVSQLHANFTVLDRETAPRFEISCQAASGSPPITYSLVGRDGHVHVRQTPRYGQPANFSFPLTQTSAWLRCQAQNSISVQSSPLTLAPPGERALVCRGGWVGGARAGKGIRKQPCLPWSYLPPSQASCPRPPPSCWLPASPPSPPSPPGCWAGPGGTGRRRGWRGAAGRRAGGLCAPAGERREVGSRAGMSPGKERTVALVGALQEFIEDLLCAARAC